MDRLLLVLLFIFGLLHPSIVHKATGIVTYPCPHPTNSRPPASPNLLPKLPEQFVVHVEANIVQKQMTSEAVEVYDFPNNRAAISITSNNQTVTSIYSYDTGERLDILPNGTCLTANLNDSSFDVFGFTELRQSGRPTIMSAADVFRFGDKFTKVFIGEETVRGIQVHHWQSCQTWSTPSLITSAAYVIDYYFSKPDHTTATADVMIPIRATINGAAINVDNQGTPIGGTHNFSHVYDFSFFRPGPIEDESLFEVPRGSVCKRKLSRTLPQLPDQFSLSMEVNVAGVPFPPMTERMMFDYDFGLIQTKRFAPRGRGERFGLTQLTIVEDYENRVQYVLDDYDGNCSVTPLPDDLSTNEGGAGDQITMKHGEQLLRYGNRDFKYQGQRTLRGMKVDVWADSTDSGLVQEVYFLADWPTERMRNRLLMVNPDVDLSRMKMLVGTYLLNTSAIQGSVGPLFQLFRDKALKAWGDKWRNQRMDSSSVTLPKPGDMLRMRIGRRRSHWDSARMQFPHASEKMINIFNYIPMHMDLSVFDVSMCYKKNAQEMYVYFVLEGSYASLVSSQRYIFMSSMRSAIARAAGISVLRVTKINVWQDMATTKLSFFFSMLEPPPFPSAAGKQLPCRDAYSKLSKAVSKGLTVTIKHPIKEQHLHVVPDSLKTWGSMKELWNKVLPDGTPASQVAGQQQHFMDHTHDTQPVQDSDNSGYSHAEFGGMAFAMLVVGVVVGMGGTYLLIRRLRPDIHLLPYQQSK